MTQVSSIGDYHPLEASFRDPSGHLFSLDGILYRQVNRVYQQHYNRLMDSGLYQVLVDRGLLVPHTEVEIAPLDPASAWKVIQPERVEFISYPYEWSFSQLKDAALATLDLQKRALAHGMTLKDSSAYNIQFHGGKPVLIDTLSFEIYTEGDPWVAYRQFCQHFLAPLSLMALRDIRLAQLLRVYIDGIPLDLTSQLLPGKTRFNAALQMHIHLHAASQKRFASSALPVKRQMSKTAMLGWIDSLETAVNGLRWSPAGTAWGDYYTETNYTPAGLEHKKALVGDFLRQIQPRRVWDLGANTGLFSRIASQSGAYTIAYDIDPGAVELNYLECRKKAEANLLPLLLDLTNPSPGIGWGNRERLAFGERTPADAILALALVHHLAIANNVPLGRLASYLHGLGRWLIVEFVPKDDSQVQRLLASRQDIFHEYTQAHFEGIFAAHYTIHRAEAIQDSLRSLYLMEARD
jgi:ribosomal protein L11 methylase PrmA